MGRTKNTLDLCGARKGSFQHKSGFPQPTDSPTGGMEIKSRSVLPGLSTARHTGDRSLCSQGKQESQKILFPLQRTGVRGGGRFNSGMGFQSSLCLSSLSPDSENPSKTELGQGQSNLDCPLVAQEDLVSHVVELDGSPSASASRTSGSSAAGPSLPSESRFLQVNSLAVERESLRNKGCSERVIDTLLLSRKPVTRRIYARVWGVFSRWCEARGARQKDNPVMLDFLQEGVDRGLATKTLRVQVAALYSFLDIKLALDPFGKEIFDG